MKSRNNLQHLLIAYKHLRVITPIEFDSDLENARKIFLRSVESAICDICVTPEFIELCDKI